MQNSSAQLLKYLEDLQATTSGDAAFDVFQRYILELGYDGVNYAYAPLMDIQNTALNRVVFMVSDLFSQDFLAHYYDSGMHKQDYPVRAILEGQLTPINWWEDYAQGRCQEGEKEALHVARNYGLTNGITLPLMSNPLGIAGASLISQDSGDTFNLLNQCHQDEAMRYLSLFHNHIWGKYPVELFEYFNGRVLVHLSNTEKQLLRLLGTGKPMKWICDELGITYRYGEKLSAKLRRNLGGISRSRLFYYAGILRVTETL